MEPRRARNHVNLRSILAILAGLIFNLFLIGSVPVRDSLHGFGDFPQLYIGAKMGVDRYDPAAIESRQAQIFGVLRPDSPPSRLPFYYALLAPLARLPYSSAAACWEFLMLACAVAAIAVQPARYRTAFIIGLAWSPVLASVVLGQDVALLLLILAAGLRLRAAGKWIASGLVFSLLTIKFHLFILLPLAFLGERMILAGGTGGVACEILVSFIRDGIAWPAAYLKLLSLPSVNPRPELMPNLHGLTSDHLTLDAALSVALALCAAVFLLRIRRRPFEVALLSSFLVSYHAYPVDTLVLLPASLSIFRSTASPIAFLCMTPLLWFFCLLGFGWISAAMLALLLIAAATSKDVSEVPCFSSKQSTPPDHR